MCLAKEELILQGGGQSSCYLRSPAEKRIVLGELQDAYCQRLFPRLELVTSWSHGGNFTSYSKASLRGAVDWMLQPGMDNVANEEEAADVELGNRDISMVLEDEERRDENDEDRGWDLPPDTNTPKIAH
ncbi:hypothetical protein T459_12979 [Capsicum annuum]|uniref:Uncharacterized protein n=1 Tax=Capsicum annuum TaxID=4072 RepID=A0A2G2ZRB8_CAPAN|nr:hypothetical protein T459_12979 [Capsicum annuum]